MADPINDKLAEDRQAMLQTVAAIHGAEAAIVAGCALGILSSYGRFLALACPNLKPEMAAEILSAGVDVNYTINHCVSALVAASTKDMSEEKRESLNTDIRALCLKDMEALIMTLKELYK